MPPTLPVEITDDIIDCLQHNRAVLLTCSVVSPSWRARVQYHLFRYIILTPPHFDERLLAVLDASPHLAAHIRSVSLALPLDSATSAAFLAHCPLPNVTDLMVLVHRNEGLAVDNTVYPGACTRLRNAFPGVRTLGIDFNNTAVPLPLLLIFPHITHLRILSGEMYDAAADAVDLQLPCAPTQSLTTLYLACYISVVRLGTHDAVMPLLMRHLRSLRLGLVENDLGNNAAALLAARTANTLEKLEMTSWSMQAIEDFAVGYRRALGTGSGALRHLDMRVVILGDRGRPEDIAHVVRFARAIALDVQTSIMVSVFHESAQWTAERVRGQRTWRCVQAVYDETGTEHVYEGPAALILLGIAEV